MEGNDRGLWITQQLGKSERGRDNQERNMYIPATAGIQVGGEGGQKGQGTGHIYCKHTCTLLTTIPLLLFLYCFFVFCFLQMVFCILYSLPWTVAFLGWCARSSVNPSGFIVPIPSSPTNTFVESFYLPASSCKQPHKFSYQSTLLSRSRSLPSVFKYLARSQRATIKHGIKMTDWSVVRFMKAKVYVEEGRHWVAYSVIKLNLIIILFPKLLVRYCGIFWCFLFKIFF